jgi:hypothetical protein
VFHCDLGSVLHLSRGAAHDFGQAGGGHRGSGADLALVAHFGAGDRGLLLVEHSDGARGEQELHGFNVEVTSRPLRARPPAACVPAVPLTSQARSGNPDGVGPFGRGNVRSAGVYATEHAEEVGPDGRTDPIPDYARFATPG